MPAAGPGSVISQLAMEVGQGAGRPGQGQGSSLLSRRGEAPGRTLPRSLDRSPADSQLSSRPSDLLLRPGKDSMLDTDSIAPEALVEDVIVKEAYKERNSIVIRWESETTNILGFRVIYRLFGTPQFKQGPPLAPSEREFKIKNVPENVSSILYNYL